ncbi:MAG TPA: sigma-70 family RNA polymerase sigma factor [Bryobacteraceae bacterium]|nr:sigma-70 family RNA polymerase sigma factor [Bryobacteraceae bacterium]
MVPTPGRVGQSVPEQAKNWTSGAAARPSESADTAACETSAEPDAGVAVPNPVDWAELVARIQRGDESGMEDLYSMFARGIRFYLCRQLGAQELDDKIHDTFVIVVQAIRRGDLREPERLMGFVRTVVRRQVAAHIDHLVHDRREQLHLDVGVRIADARRNPEQSVALQERIELMLEVLRELSERDREILTRFYLHEQSQEQICAEMNLTDTQFRLLKSRAKARFGELGQRKLQQKPRLSLFVRKSPDSAHSTG